MTRILVLGGAQETDAAMRALKEAGCDVALYASRLPAGGTRSDSLRAGLAWAEALVDVTHAFDNSLRQVADLIRPDLPAVRLARPLWRPEPSDRWQDVPDLAAGLAALPAKARVFAATGRDSAEMLAHHDGPVFLRQLHEHTGTSPSNCTFVFGQGPFEVDEEVSLFRSLQIEVVMARNTGGLAGFPKIAAARAMDLPVVLISPPGRETQKTVSQITDMLDWVAGL